MNTSEQIEVLAGSQKDYTTDCIILENNLFQRRPFNDGLPLSKVAPFYIIAEYQNYLNLNEGKNLNKLFNIIENSINFN